MRRFEGKVVFVSGAGSGIGLAAARRLAREGGRVVCGIENDEQRAAVGELDAVVIDVALEESWRAAIAWTVNAHGGLDALVCCAGILRKGTAEETGLDLWNRVLAVNLDGVFLGARHAVPEMRRRGGGTIVNVCLAQRHPRHARRGGLCRLQGRRRGADHGDGARPRP